MASFEVPVRDAPAAEPDRIALPGFGLPLREMPNVRNRFYHAICDSVNGKPITSRERRMMEFINHVTDKPKWDEKIFDEEIVTKWKEESTEEILTKEVSDQYLNDKMFDYCIAELRDKAARFKSTGFVAVYDIDDNCTIAKSDTAVRESLRASLNDLIKPLEDVPAKYKDWHPGSEEQVLDLVHPSLFPLIYGVSRVLPKGTVPMLNCAEYIGMGELTSNLEELVREPNQDSTPFGPVAWGAFQWLPSNIKFDENGKIRVTSYINNLHPEQHEELYAILEAVVDATIPLWNEVLATYVQRMRIEIPSSGRWCFQRIAGKRYPHNVTPSGLQVKEKDESDDETDWELQHDDDYASWRRANSVMLWPEPETYVPYDELITREGTKRVDLKKDFAETGLQVIFKLANIHLTPEKPEYAGGTWHIEGALNEHIVASAIYYFDQDNITESSLGFRHFFDEEDMIMSPDQNDYEAATFFFGVEQDGTNEQDIGAVSTSPNRLLVFPNTVQHRVQPFQLADASRPGHRKILAMFLVDPHIRVLSTANVPPQRRDWWAREVVKIDRFATLPPEIFERIIAQVDGFPLSWRQAEEVRERLMNERRGINDDTTELKTMTISFCEH